MTDDGVIVDSDLDFALAVEGTAAPQQVLESLCLIDVCYCGFEASSSCTGISPRIYWNSSP
jgi:hypothetical protein